MRRIGGSFWTPNRDRRLQAYEAKGVSAAVIAERLGTTRNAVLGRSQRLRGLTVTYNAYVEKGRLRRAAAESKRRDEQRLTRAAIARMRSEIVRGIPRDVAVISALKSGATYHAVADAIGVTQQRVQQIWKGKEPRGRGRYSTRRDRYAPEEIP